MTIRFAAARPIGNSAAVFASLAQTSLDPANDNGGGLPAGSDRLLKAALRHFAAYGLSAAEQARRNAEKAFFAGNSEDYRWWLAICAALDRRMAKAVTFHRGAAAAAKPEPADLAGAVSPKHRANDAS